MSYQKQVDKNHYSFEKYIYPNRWMSYWYQTKEIVSKDDIKSVLDVGPGTTFMKDMLKMHRPDIKYNTLDLASDLQPDILGSVTSIPCDDNTYDCVTAFQVLEHIEFKDFENALSEMARVSKKNVLISLPHFGPQLTFSCKFPFIPKLQFAIKIPWPKKLHFSGQHYWEVGRKGYSPRFIRSVIKKHLVIKDEYVPFENQYHHFYILKKK